MKKALSIVTLILLHFISFRTAAQLEYSKWYFGNYAGLDFANNPPTAILNSSLITSEGCASICDNAGNLLFYTEGGSIRNSSNALMANGSGLFGGGGTTTQAATIVKLPGSNTIFYVFTLQALGGNVYYSIVDMSLAAGSGSVVSKNNLLYNSSCEKQIMVKHCNGKDIWHLSHENGTNNFRAYLITSSGINLSPIISSVGDQISGSTLATQGEIKISPDGKKLAMATYTASVPNNLGNSGYRLFDFDPSTGVVSNSLVLNNQPYAYGLAFSPDGTKLYGSMAPALITNAIIYQWNVCASTSAAIVASQYSFDIGLVGSGSMQRGIDGKIYLSVGNQQSISVIHNPNSTGLAMGFTLNSLSIAPKMCGLGLPNFINPFTKPSPQAFTNTIACNQVNFSPPPVPTFTSGCSSTPYPPSGYLWDFGEPSSGTANTSSLSSPNHVYASIGTYTVKLVLLNACTNDTLIQSVNITTLGPTPAVTGPTLICKGDRYNYTVSGGSTYLWSTGSTATSVALQPTQTTVYTVSATANGCTQSKTFTVTVNPCLGIEDLQAAGVWKVFPNPVVNELKIESAFEGNVKLFDLNGRLVFETRLQPGENNINISDLNGGVYNLQLSNPSLTRNLRIVKVE